MNEIDLIKRIESLENAVFNKIQNSIPVKKNSSLEKEYSQFLNVFKSEITALKSHFLDDDYLTFQAILHNGNSSEEYHLTSLSTLVDEEKDEDISSMCAILSSPQRVSILRYLSQRSLSSGELVALTHMAGGHLHHHLKELQSKSFVKKDSLGRYSVTNYGINVYLSIASLNRKLTYKMNQNKAT